MEITSEVDSLYICMYFIPHFKTRFVAAYIFLQLQVQFLLSDVNFLI